MGKYIIFPSNKSPWVSTPSWNEAKKSVVSFHPSIFNISYQKNAFEDEQAYCSRICVKLAACSLRWFTRWKETWGEEKREDGLRKLWIYTLFTWPDPVGTGSESMYTLLIYLFLWKYTWRDQNRSFFALNWEHLTNLRDIHWGISSSGIISWWPSLAHLPACTSKSTVKVQRQALSLGSWQAWGMLIPARILLCISMSLAGVI